VYVDVVVGFTVSVPLVPLVPVQAPLAVHDVAFVEDQVRVDDPPEVTDVGDAEIVTVGAGFVGGTIDTSIVVD
jgi:hypothetical protein